MTDIARKALDADSAIETKLIEAFEIKDMDRGEVTAVVSTMNVVDREGDVILSGAIKDGSVVKLSAYEHDVITEGKPPVGRGVVTIQGDRAVLNAKYFMSTERGRDAFNTVKEMGTDSEWSIGFPRAVKTAPMTDEWKAKGARRLIAELTLLESSPVFMGANGLTGTVSAKAATEIALAEEAPAEIPPTPDEVRAQLRAELKSARELVSRLEREEANLTAKEIFQRFNRNMQRARA